MAEKGNEQAEKATKKAEKGEDPAAEFAKSPGPAPMGGGDAEPNAAAESKVKSEDAGKDD